MACEPVRATITQAEYRELYLLERTQLYASQTGETVEAVALPADYWQFVEITTETDTVRPISEIVRAVCDSRLKWLYRGVVAMRHEQEQAIPVDNWPVKVEAR
jgi:hypothetical protein